MAASRPSLAGALRYPQQINAPTGLIVLVLNVVLVNVFFILGQLLRGYLRRQLRSEARAESDSRRTTLAAPGT